MYYCGIDVAKRAHTGVGLDDDGQVIRAPFTITHDQAGIQALLDWLGRCGDDVAVGLESTGHYWLALYDQLTRAGYEVRVLNPLQVHAFQRSGVRRRTTDSVDAVWIAEFIRVSNTLMAPPSPDVILQLRQVARFRFSLTDQIGDAKRKVLAVLDRVFPEYESLFSNVFIASSRQLLAEAVTAQDFAAFDLQEMTRLLHVASRGRFGQAKAEAISQTARRSIGVAFLADAARLEVNCLLAQIEFLTNQVADIDQVLDQLVAPLPE